MVFNLIFDQDSHDCSPLLKTIEVEVSFFIINR